VRHFASSKFWARYRSLPEPVRHLADKNFQLLKADPGHPSLHLKKIGQFVSVRIGLHHRALASPVDGGLLWFWIGTHADYDAMLR
jgi:hypothetical protein